MLSNFRLEEIEREYFRYILTFLRANLEPIIEGLNSRIKIFDDWYSIFMSRAGRYKKRPSDLDTGAERILHHFFASILHLPNSSPIGSDLMFETPDIDNPADYKGKINIGINQTSYKIGKVFLPNLPKYYGAYGKYRKPCLTYIIQIVHEHAKPNIKALVLVCVPNGQLYSVYGKSIYRCGKTKGTSFRFLYSAEPHFRLLTERYKEKIFRIELVYLEKQLKAEDITDILAVPLHFQF